MFQVVYTCFAKNEYCRFLMERSSVKEVIYTCGEFTQLRGKLQNRVKYPTRTVKKNLDW